MVLLAAVAAVVVATVVVIQLLPSPLTALRWSAPPGWRWAATGSTRDVYSAALLPTCALSRTAVTNEAVCGRP